MLFGIVILTLSEVNISLVDPIPSYAWPIGAIGICLIILSLGMFDAVGIQFGMDQMVEASSDQISAFTHWYYGPFTTEEVEDVKTFLLLLLVLVSLFGFHLAGNGYSLLQHLNCKLCLSAIVHDGVSVSPNILQTVTVLVSVPILHFANLPRFHRYIPNMLHRLGIRVVLVFFQELAEMVIVLASWEDYGTCSSLITNRHSLFLSLLQ